MSTKRRSRADPATEAAVAPADVTSSNAAPARKRSKSNISNGIQATRDCIVIDGVTRNPATPLRSMLNKPVKQFTCEEKLVARHLKALLKLCKQTLPLQVTDMAAEDLTAYVNHLIALGYQTNDLQWYNLLCAKTISTLLGHAMHPLIYNNESTSKASDRLCQSVIALANDNQQQRTHNITSDRNDWIKLVATYHGIALDHQAHIMFDYQTMDVFLPQCATYRDELLKVKLEAEHSDISSSANSSVNVHEAAKGATCNTVEDHRQRCIITQTRLLTSMRTRLPLWCNRIVTADLAPRLSEAIERAAKWSRVDSSKYSWDAILGLIRAHVHPLHDIQDPIMEAISSLFHRAVTDYAERCLIERSPGLQLPLNEATFAMLTQKQHTTEHVHAHSHLKTVLDYLSFNDIIQLRQVSQQWRGLIQSTSSFDTPLTITGKRMFGPPNVYYDQEVGGDRLLERLYTIPPNSLHQCRFLIIGNSPNTPTSLRFIENKEDYERLLHVMTIACPSLERLVFVHHDGGGHMQFPSYHWAAILQFRKLNAVWLHRACNSQMYDTTKQLMDRPESISKQTLCREDIKRFDQLFQTTLGGGEQAMVAVLAMDPSKMPAHRQM